MILFKLTKRKLKLLLPPPELVLQAGLLSAAPRHVAKLFPGLRNIVQFFFAKPLTSAELYPEEKPYKGFICFPFQLGWGSTPLHFPQQFPPSHILAISRGLFSPGSTGRHPQTESTSLTAWDDVLQCKAHPQAFPTISTDSPSLLLGLFYLFFPSNAGFASTN